MVKVHVSTATQLADDEMSSHENIVMWNDEIQPKGKTKKNNMHLCKAGNEPTQGSHQKKKG